MKSKSTLIILIQIIYLISISAIAQTGKKQRLAPTSHKNMSPKKPTGHGIRSVAPTNGVEGIKLESDFRGNYACTIRKYSDTEPGPTTNVLERSTVLKTQVGNRDPVALIKPNSLSVLVAENAKWFITRRKVRRNGKDSYEVEISTQNAGEGKSPVVSEEKVGSSIEGGSESIWGPPQRMRRGLTDYRIFKLREDEQIDMWSFKLSDVGGAFEVKISGKVDQILKCQQERKFSKRNKPNPGSIPNKDGVIDKRTQSTLTPSVLRSADTHDNPYPELFKFPVGSFDIDLDSLDKLLASRQGKGNGERKIRSLINELKELEAAPPTTGSDAFRQQEKARRARDSIIMEFHRMVEEQRKHTITQMPPSEFEWLNHIIPWGDPILGFRKSSQHVELLELYSSLPPSITEQRLNELLGE